MKTLSSLLVLAAVLLLLPALPAEAKGKSKGKKPAAVGALNTAQPAEALTPYIHRLDQLLALDRPGGKGSDAFFAEAPGRLVTLRATFTEEREQAEEGDRGKFEAAIATCDVLTKALEERTAALGNINASGAVAGSGKLEQGPRKDNLTQGIKGGGIAKAVGSLVERDRERAENKQAKASAARSDNALSTMAANKWSKRSSELRQQINDAYARIK
ncbi:MAG: hypothetical protein QOE70_5714 [Chthoniobacter sp.]|jgi:hypothetical protein|nr:hypothetical protein [Chthoniobacter sp.]